MTQSQQTVSCLAIAHRRGEWVYEHFPAELAIVRFSPEVIHRLQNIGKRMEAVWAEHQTFCWLMALEIWPQPAGFSVVWLALREDLTGEQEDEAYEKWLPPYTFCEDAGLVESDPPAPRRLSPAEEAALYRYFVPLPGEDVAPPRIRLSPASKGSGVEVVADVHFTDGCVVTDEILFPLTGDKPFGLDAVTAAQPCR